MAGARTNQGLLVALVVALGTGFAGYVVGTGWNLWATVSHGASGYLIVALTPWKSVVVRRGVRRRGLLQGIPSFALVAVVVVTVLTGILHRIDQRDLGPVLVMQVHVAAAIVVVPLVASHLRTRPTQFRGVGVDRRTALRAGALAGASTVVMVALPHASNRHTRSLERGSFDPEEMPVVQWFDDDVPSVDPERWRLAVAGREWTLDEMRALVADEPEQRTSALDCTGGWYAWQRWRGVSLHRLLGESGDPKGRSVRVESVTGYWRRFPRSDVGEMIVALECGGQALSRGHGFPARLVVPGRRGYWWVKWLARIDVDDTPWWWQPPLPVT